MNIQSDLFDHDKNLKFENNRTLLKLEPNGDSLEKEKQNFIMFSSEFIDRIDFEGDQCNGRPRFYLKDVLKSLLVMSFNGMSYRRAESDLLDLKNKGILNHIPKRSTLNKYMLLEETKKLIEELIQVSALFFVDHEDTLILDSTWLATRMYTGGYRKVYDKTSTPLRKCRKLHIACLKNSRIVCCARVSIGTVNDSRYFKDLLSTTIKNGFMIDKLLADAGYTGKDNYAFCQALNIRNVFIDFRKNASPRRVKSSMWRKQLKMFREDPEIWHENYRFRVIVESIFSSLKKKYTNYLRSRKEIAQDVELLLKCLCYNFTIISRFS